VCLFYDNIVTVNDKGVFMKRLHKTQQQLLELLKDSITDPLTIREIQAKLGLSSSSLVYHHIQQLEKKGYLRRNPSNSRDYQILADSPEKKITYLNLYGLTFCGPNGTILDENPVDHIPISSRILGFSSAEAFMVKAKGDSMIPKINDGDLVIVQKSKDAENGSTVVCINSGEALIKKIQKTNVIILISNNPKYQPFVASDDFRIVGIVKGVYTYSI